MVVHIDAARTERERAEIGIRGIFGEREEGGFRTAFGECPVCCEEGGGGCCAFAGDVNEC